MRKPILLTLLTFLFAFASAAEDRHQSYISYDDGGTVIRGEDGREIEAHRNVPVYPGDEIITSRRGRAEVRLSDGNIIGIDRTTALQIHGVVDSYEGDADQTVVELRHGKVAVYRTDIGRDRVRLDTEMASYVADYEAIYSVETDSRGRDRVVVFDGYVEVRTRTRASRLRAGESAEIDSRGTYDLVSGQRYAADDFERWFLDRFDRFSRRSTQYVDGRLSYWADDLDQHGRWVFVTGVGWSWRPFVAVGWRPYHHGYWHHSRGGSLVWVSYDPWGWGPYHYGRWAYDPGFGWVWVPGYAYSPAWVYWWYGPSYVGWAPAGWWDCYRPYYNWAYEPYRNRTFGYGFYGRVKINDMDLRPWTFVDSGTLVSTRIDRAALTTDAVKHRLGRTPGGFATISGSPARFTREDVRDPAEAIRRRGLDGSMTGRETGAPPADLTPFFRRDAEVGATVRDRIVSARGASPAGGIITGGGNRSTSSGGTIQRGNGGVAPIGSGSVAPIGSGSVAPITGGSPAPAAPPATAAGGRGDSRGTGGRIERGGSGAVQPPRDAGQDRGTSAGREGAAVPPARDSGDWRGRIDDRRSEPVTPPRRSAEPAPADREAEKSAWRDRGRSVERPSEATAPSRGSSSTGSRDVPRRVIEGIGGARVVPRERTGAERTPDRAPAARDHGRSSGSRESVRSRGDSGSSRSSASSGSRSGGGSSSSGSSSAGSSGSSSSSSSSSGNRGGGGKIERDN